MFKKGIGVVVVILFFLLIYQEGTAKSIIGGYLQIRPISNSTTRYRVSLKLHVDETTRIDETGGFVLEDVVNVKVIRKRDGSEVESFKLLRKSSEKANYDLDLCFGVAEYQSVYINFEAEISINLQSYSDAEGYYLEWTNCCRLNNIRNIESSELYTIKLQTLFPAVMYANVPFFNSTPTVGDLSELLVCKQALLEHKIIVDDPDGDELRFSLVKPEGNFSGSDFPIEWRPGFSSNNAIPGNPALTIDSQTGLLTVKSEEHGQYVFAVCVEEYRNGRRIGATVREYMLYILDCLSAVNTDRKVYLDNIPVSTVTICPGNRTTLHAKTNPDSRYQWMRNGKEIPGATSSSLEVTQEGDYSFNIYRSGNCANTVESKKVHVTGANSSFKLEKQGTSTSCDQPGETVLVGPKDLHYTYRWYKDNILLTNKNNSLTASEPGDYWAVVESSSCKLSSDTITIEQSANPNVTVAMEPILPVCGNDETPIRLLGSPAGGTFQGPGVVGDTFNPKQAGVGVHQLTYSIASSAPCPIAVAKQTVEVYDWPEFNLSEEICVTNGTGSKIGIKESVGWRYEWFPQEGLDKPFVSMPVVTTDVDRLFTLTATNSDNCKTAKQIQVKICAKLSIPNAFTPNQDGINDAWELRGIDHFPDAEVTIFNRWGNVIFHSKGYAKPFDGAENQAGVYHYKIKLDESIPLKNGPLMLIR